MEKAKSEFQERFEHIRNEKGLKDHDIAQKLGMSRPNFSQVKRNGNPRYKTIQKLADALLVHPGVFFSQQV